MGTTCYRWRVLRYPKVDAIIRLPRDFAKTYIETLFWIFGEFDGYLWPSVDFNYLNQVVDDVCRCDSMTDQRDNYLGDFIASLSGGRSSWLRLATLKLTLLVMRLFVSLLESFVYAY